MIIKLVSAYDVISDHCEAIEWANGTTPMIPVSEEDIENVFRFLEKADKRRKK